MRMRLDLQLIKLCVAWFTLSSLCLFGQTESAIVSGHVFDSEGRGLPGAKIVVFPLEVSLSGPLPFAMTDETGRYRLISPPFGKTRLCAVKESAGYPDVNGLLFFSGKEQRPIVNLTKGAQLEEDIALGEPDGILNGTVVDSSNLKPVQTARMTLRRLDNVSAFLSTGLPKDGHFLYALPAVPISITVTAPGYEEWTYRDPETLGRGLVLASSTQRTLTVQLVPNK